MYGGTIKARTALRRKRNDVVLYVIKTIVKEDYILWRLSSLRKHFQVCCSMWIGSIFDRMTRNWKYVTIRDLKIAL
jgi:hypothetical protein